MNLENLFSIWDCLLKNKLFLEEKTIIEEKKDTEGAIALIN